MSHQSEYRTDCSSHYEHEPGRIVPLLYNPHPEQDASTTPIHDQAQHRGFQRSGRSHGGLSIRRCDIISPGQMRGIVCNNERGEWSRTLPADPVKLQLKVRSEINNLASPDISSNNLSVWSRLLIRCLNSIYWTAETAWWDLMA